MEDQEKKLDVRKMNKEERAIRFSLACSDYIRDPNKEALDFIGKEAHQVTVLEFVEVLGPYMIAKEEETKLNAISLLIDGCKMWTLNKEQASCLGMFLAGRLTERYNILPKILSGLTALVDKREVERSTAFSITTAFFEHVDIQALHQETRRLAYTLLSSLLERHLVDFVDGMNEEFVRRYALAIDGEQDPRNLVIVFRMTVIVLQHFNLAGMEEQLFDVVTCYYPIDFTPPPDEPNFGVTAKQLTTALENCMKASDKLAPHIIPFLLEKLGSSVMKSRIGACKTLKSCIMSFGTTAIEGFLQMIWKDIRTEIFGGLNAELREACLNVLSALVWVLTLPNIRTKDPVRFIEEVLSFCVEKLGYSEERFAKSTGDIMVAIVKSSGVGCGLVAEHCLPTLMSYYTNAASEESQRQWVEQLVGVLYEMGVENSRANQAVKHIPWTMLETEFLLCLKSSEELCSAALSGVHALFNLYHTLRESNPEADQLNISEIVRNIYTLLCNKPSASVEESGLNILTLLSKEYPELVNSLLLHPLLDKVDAGESGALSMLSRLLVGELFVEHSKRLMKRLALKEDLEIIATLSSAASVQEKEAVIKYSTEYLFYQMLQLFIQAAISDEDSELNTEKAILLFQTFTKTVFQNNPGIVDMIEFTAKYRQSEIFQPFKEGSPAVQTQLISILSTVLSFGAASNTFDPSVTRYNVSDPLLFISTASDTLTLQAVTSIAGTMLNRLEEGPVLDDLISSVVYQYGCSQGVNKVWICVRACQALVYRCHETSEFFIKQFIRCLTDPNLHSDTADLSHHVLDPLPRGRRSVLYKQRFLIKFVELLSEVLPLTEPSASSVVKCVGVLLLSVPPSLIEQHVDVLYPLLLEGLGRGLAQSRSLQILQHLMTNLPHLLASQLDSLITSLCNVCSSEVNVRCRVEAYSTLEQCAVRFPLTKTHLHRDKVLRRSRKGLGDKKRVVRVKCAECINAWTMLAEQG